MLSSANYGILLLVALLSIIPTVIAAPVHRQIKEKETVIFDVALFGEAMEFVMKEMAMNDHLQRRFMQMAEAGPNSQMLEVWRIIQVTQELKNDPAMKPFMARLNEILAKMFNQADSN